MNIWHKKYLYYILLIIFTYPLTALAQQVVFYGAELPAMIQEGKNGALHGFSVDLLLAAVKASDVALQEPVIKSMPWARSLAECRSDPNAALLALTMLPSRKTEYKWVGPIATVRLGLYALKDSGIAINRAEDIARYRVGVVRSTAPTRFLPESLGLKKLHLEQVNNVRASIRMLRVGRLDLTIQAEPGFTSLLREMNISGDEFVRVYDLKPMALYFAFNRFFDDEYIRGLRAGMLALHARPADGGPSRYDALCREYWAEGSRDIGIPGFK